jgi:hypothetical protein
VKALAKKFRSWCQRITVPSNHTNLELWQDLAHVDLDDPVTAEIGLRQRFYKKP